MADLAAECVKFGQYIYMANDDGPVVIEIIEVECIVFEVWPGVEVVPIKVEPIFVDIGADIIEVGPIVVNVELVYLLAGLAGVKDLQLLG